MYYLFCFILVTVKVDKVPYTLQFCDTAGQVSLHCFSFALHNKFCYELFLFYYFRDYIYHKS